MTSWLRRAALLTAAGLLAACSSSAGRASVFARAPVRATPPHAASTARCTPPPALLTASTGRRYVRVDPGPVSVRAAWYPGLNRVRCREPVTLAGAVTARRLAHDIDVARPYPPGRYACPADFERAVQLYFRFAHEHDETAVVTLTGCAAITAPGRSRLQEGDSVGRDLRPLAPVDLRAGLGP